MNVRAALLRAIALYRKLRAEAKAEHLEAEERAEVFEALATVSVLAVLTDLDRPEVRPAAVGLGADMTAATLAVIVSLGEFFAEREATDGVGTVDAFKVKALAKWCPDQFLVSDAFTRQSTKGLGDAATSVEQLVFSIARELADVVLAVDQHSALLFGASGGRGDDLVGVADHAGLSSDKEEADSASASDAASAHPLKGVDDALEVVDELARAWWALREFWDGPVAVSDAHALEIGPRPTSAIGPMVESLVLALDAGISDLALLLETAALSAGIAVADAPTATDVAVASTSLKRQDTASGADAGIVSLSDYAVDYFAEDYVLTDTQTF